MTRKEAKKMAQSRDCHCIEGKDRDNNYNECIDKVFDYFESNKIIIRNCSTCAYVLNLDIENKKSFCGRCGRTGHIK